MTAMDPTRRQQIARRNRNTAIAAFGVVAGMVGVSFAAVPLYDLFCRMTGFGGTPMIGQAAPATPGDLRVTVRFNANTHPGLPWRFEAAQPSMQLRVGEEGVGFYTARNTSDRPATGVSTYNVTPEVVGKYFHKVACFCFEEQTLEPGQRVDMPVTFWVDPRIAEDPNTRDVRTITLSYTMHPSPLPASDSSQEAAEAGDASVIASAQPRAPQIAPAIKN